MVLLRAGKGGEGGGGSIKKGFLLTEDKTRSAGSLSHYLETPPCMLEAHSLGGSLWKATSLDCNANGVVTSSSVSDFAFPSPLLEIKWTTMNVAVILCV